MFEIKTNRVNILKRANEDFTAVNRVGHLHNGNLVRSVFKFEIVDFTIFFEKQQRVFENV